jgi:EAL domain-containing protein (putative c-di-GMP-specific phosphodiesterase class I)
MLVSRSPSWARAVSGATRALDGASFHTCLARDALARLAGTRARYSHLLVDENDADGLLNELADLAVEVAAPDTDMLVLGAADTSRPNVRVITAATARSVRKALMTTTPPRDRAAIDLTELRAALQHARIETRYQPIIRMEDRCPIGLEALARLNHPQQGTLLPDRFVPQIEDAGLAADLTRLVSARALTDMLGPYLADRSVSMSVNFPLDVLLHPAALDLLEAQRSAAGIPASRIIVELTESRPVHDFPMLRKSLDRLRGLGYGAAIDDVGPAVPRLAPLLDLPFTSLKLDKDLVQQVLDSPEIHAFLEETIRQAKARNLTVVAEGVETDAIWQTMQSLGADQAQGFLAARPLPIAAVPIWWDAWIAPSAIGRPA